MVIQTSFRTLILNDAPPPNRIERDPNMRIIGIRDEPAFISRIPDSSRPSTMPASRNSIISGTFTFWARRPQNEPTARILPNESKLCLAISIAAEDSIVTLHHLVYLYDQAPRSMLYGERDAITFSASHRKPAIRLIDYTTVNDRMMSRVLMEVIFKGSTGYRTCRFYHH